MNHYSFLYYAYNEHFQIIKAFHFPFLLEVSIYVRNIWSSSTKIELQPENTLETLFLYVYFWLHKCLMTKVNCIYLQGFNSNESSTFWFPFQQQCRTSWHHQNPHLLDQLEKQSTTESIKNMFCHNSFHILCKKKCTSLCYTFLFRCSL